MDIPEKIKRYYNNYGTCLDIDYSIYKYNMSIDGINEYDFYFTSQVNLQRFSDNWVKWHLSKSTQLKLRYNPLKFEEVFYILDLYVKIEKRGFRVEKNGNKISKINIE